MLRFVTAIALTLAVALPTAHAAEVNVKRYQNLSKVECDDAQTISDAELIWKNFKTSGGQQSSSIYGDIKIISSKPRGKASNKLICNVTLKYTKLPHIGRQRGVFILTVFPTGKFRVSWTPNS